MGYGISSGSAQFAAETVGATKSLAVPQAVSEIDNEIYRLEELAGQLISRISPLIAPRSAVSANSKTEPSTCEFASVLGGKSDRIRAVADRISSALADLEF